MRHLSLSFLSLVSIYLAPVRASSAEFEKSVSQYVIASGKAVEVTCDEGSKLLRGDCLAQEVMENGDPKRDVRGIPLRELPNGIYLKSVQDQNGWRCETSHQSHRQTLRVTARVFCER